LAAPVTTIGDKNNADKVLLDKLVTTAAFTADCFIRTIAYFYGGKIF